MIPSNSEFDTEIKKSVAKILRLSKSQRKMSDAEAADLYKACRVLFKALLRRAGYSERAVVALTTKFNDAGPRSAPWKPTSSLVPGRPQDGSDGNRIKRWLLPKDHKFYSTQADGTLVAIKYIFQTLSMTGAPKTPQEISDAMSWLTDHPIRPGEFRDPIQKTEVSLEDFIKNPRLMTSGHLNPLDRGGRHLPENTSLLLKQSNDLQGNNTIDELLELMTGILQRHGKNSGH